jgi:hypothetical protein
MNTFDRQTLVQKSMLRFTCRRKVMRERGFSLSAIAVFAASATPMLAGCGHPSRTGGFRRHNDCKESPDADTFSAACLEKQGMVKR